jgi:hypothetical protein
LHMMDGHVPSKCMHLDEKFLDRLRGSVSNSKRKVEIVA